MGKTVLISGGSGGIGSAIACELAKNGYDIIINYCHSKDRAFKLSEQISEEYKVKAQALYADVSCEEDVKAMIREADREFGGVDILINNAGIDMPDLFHNKTAADFRKILDVNVVGAYLLAKEVYPHMKEQEYGRIINISSTNGINTYYPMCFDYDASKAALNSLTHNLALQFAPYVNVNAIAAGFIGTENELSGYDEQFLKSECEKILVGRYGKPQEVAYLVRFLISAEADFINNSIIRLDGGQYGSC